MKLKHIIFANYCVYLTACTNQVTQLPTEFQLPEKVNFKGEEFVLAKKSQIDEMQHILYLPKGKKADPEHWQQGILFFLDKNSKQQTLVERSTLRLHSFQQKAKVETNIEITQNNELRTDVIYPPTERYKNVQLDVARGRNLVCGFGEMQYSEKRSDYAKNLQNLRSYRKDLMQLAIQFSKLNWQIQCK